MIALTLVVLSISFLLVATRASRYSLDFAPRERSWSLSWPFSKLSSNARTRVSSVVKSHRWQYPVLSPALHFGPQHSAVRIWSSVGRFMLPPFHILIVAA